MIYRVITIAIMSPLLLFFAVSLSLWGVEAQDECQLCMRTYKISCSICYNVCEESHPLISCMHEPNSHATSLTNESCLSTCCESLASWSTFSEPGFNLCMERDAFVPSDINIGLTLGLILGLLAVLAIAGLAKQIGLMKKLDELEYDTNR